VTDNSAETRQSKKQDRENQSVQQNYRSNNDKYLCQSVHKCRTSKIDCTRKKPPKENLTKDRPHAEIVCNNQTRDNSDGIYNLKSSRNRGAITF